MRDLVKTIRHESFRFIFYLSILQPGKFHFNSLNVTFLLKSKEFLIKANRCESFYDLKANTSALHEFYITTKAFTKVCNRFILVYNDNKTFI